MDVKWIKITTSIFDDEKIKLIDGLPDRDAVFVIWIKLLTLAGKCNASGELLIADTMPYTDDMLATIFNRPIATVRFALEVFARYKMIEIGDTIRIVNWEKHQNEAALEVIREKERERKQLQRNKPKKQILDKAKSKHTAESQTNDVPLLSGTCPGQTPEVPPLELELDIDKELEEDTHANSCVCVQNLEVQNPGIPNYPKLVYEAWNESGGIQVSNLLRWMNDTWPAIALSLRGLHSKDVLAAIENYKTVLSSPGYWWKTQLPAKTFFTKHLDRFLPEAKPLENLRETQKGTETETPYQGKSLEQIEAELAAEGLR